MLRLRLFQYGVHPRQAFAHLFIRGSSGVEKALIPLPIEIIVEVILRLFQSLVANEFGRKAIEPVVGLKEVPKPRGGKIMVQPFIDAVFCDFHLPMVIAISNGIDAPHFLHSLIDTSRSISLGDPFYAPFFFQALLFFFMPEPKDFIPIDWESIGVIFQLKYPKIDAARAPIVNLIITCL